MTLLKFISKLLIEERPEFDFSIESARIWHERTVTFILTIFSGYLIHNLCPIYFINFTNAQITQRPKKHLKSVEYIIPTMGNIIKSHKTNIID